MKELHPLRRQRLLYALIALRPNQRYTERRKLMVEHRRNRPTGDASGPEEATSPSTPSDCVTPAAAGVLPAPPSTLWTMMDMLLVPESFDDHCKSLPSNVFEARRQEKAEEGKTRPGEIASLRQQTEEEAAQEAAKALKALRMQRWRTLEDAVEQNDLCRLRFLLGIPLLPISRKSRDAGSSARAASTARHQQHIACPLRTPHRTLSNEDIGIVNGTALRRGGAAVPTSAPASTLFALLARKFNCPIVVEEIADLLRVDSCACRRLDQHHRVISGTSIADMLQEQENAAEGKVTCLRALYGPVDYSPTVIHRAIISGYDALAAELLHQLWRHEGSIMTSFLVGVLCDLADDRGRNLVHLIALSRAVKTAHAIAEIIHRSAATELIYPEPQLLHCLGTVTGEEMIRHICQGLRRVDTSGVPPIHAATSSLPNTRRANEGDGGAERHRGSVASAAVVKEFCHCIMAAHTYRLTRQEWLMDPPRRCVVSPESLVERCAGDLYEFLTTRASRGITTLHESVRRNCLPSVRYLLNPTFTPIREPSGEHWTPSLVAKVQQKVLHLMKAGEYINAVDEDNQTPLWIAANKGHSNCVPLLLAAGGTVNTTNNHSISPLDIAVRRGFIDTTTLLLQAGAFVDRAVIDIARGRRLSSHARTNLLWVAAKVTEDPYHNQEEVRRSRERSHENSPHRRTPSHTRKSPATAGWHHPPSPATARSRRDTESPIQAHGTTPTRSPLRPTMVDREEVEAMDELERLLYDHWYTLESAWGHGGSVAVEARGGAVSQPRRAMAAEATPSVGPLFILCLCIGAVVLQQFWSFNLVGAGRAGNGGEGVGLILP